jgi:hypothetical protein
VTLPADSEFVPALANFSEALGLNTDSDLERSLGRRVVDALPDA